MKKSPTECQIVFKGKKIIVIEFSTLSHFDCQYKLKLILCWYFKMFVSFYRIICWMKFTWSKCIIFGNSKNFCTSYGFGDAISLVKKFSLICKFSWFDPVTNAVIVAFKDATMHIQYFTFIWYQENIFHYKSFVI